MLNSFTLNGPVPLSFPTLFRQALVAALRANPTVASIVGTRVFNSNVSRTQPAPNLTFQIRSNRREQDLDGPTGVANARVRYTCRSQDLGDVDTLREQLRNLFDGSSKAIGGVSVLNVFSDDEEDQFEQPADSSDAQTYEEHFTLIYRYYEPAPSLS